MKLLKGNYRSLCKDFPHKTTQGALSTFFLEFTVAFACDRRMRRLGYTLEQGSQAIKYTDDTVHDNVLNPENSVRTHSATTR